MENYSKEILSEIISNKLDKQIIKKKKQWIEENRFHTNYFYIDDVLPSDVVIKIYKILSSVNKKLWNKRKTFRESKQEFVKLDETNKIISNITEAFHSKKVIERIGLITNIKNLKADASLYAGGVSMMCNNDFLNPHIDNSHDASKKILGD